MNRLINKLTVLFSLFTMSLLLPSCRYYIANMTGGPRQNIRSLELKCSEREPNIIKVSKEGALHVRFGKTTHVYYEETLLSQQYKVFSNSFNYLFLPFDGSIITSERWYIHLKPTPAVQTVYWTATRYFISIEADKDSRGEVVYQDIKPLDSIVAVRNSGQFFDGIIVRADGSCDFISREDSHGAQ